jgi:hypothetical protein
MENKNVFSKKVSGRSLIAAFLLIGGLLCGIYYLAFFDTSVELSSPFNGIDRVNNIGLMQDRQNGIYLGFGAAVVGLALEYFGKRKDKEEK